MANTYSCGNDIYSLMDEEDRECDNDLKRAMTHYYNTLTEINLKFLDIMDNMNNEELKMVLTRIPIKKIDTF